MAGRYPRPGAPTGRSPYMRPDTSGRTGENPYPWLGKVFSDTFRAGGDRLVRGSAREGLGRGLAPEQIESFSPLSSPPPAQAALSGGVRGFSSPSKKGPTAPSLPELPRLKAVEATDEGPGFLKRNKDILLDLGLGMMSGKPGANFLETVGTAGLNAIDRNEAREQRDIDRKSALKADLRADGYAKGRAKEIEMQAKKFERSGKEIIQWSTDKEGYLIGVTRDPDKPFEPKDGKGNRIRPPKTAKDSRIDQAISLMEVAGTAGQELTFEQALATVSGSAPSLGYNAQGVRIK